MADKKPANPALRMLGLPNLPSKLPSRNWLIFWGISTSFAAAIIYDRREKTRATARWAAAVAPLAHEPLPDHDNSAMPRRITVYLEAPPGDGLRSAQDHFKEYIKPVLANSGLDWEFVVGRRQGDIRAVVAERIRRRRRQEAKEANANASGESEAEADASTDDDIVETIRRRNGIQDYVGVKGDLVVGRTTWKEYVRGLHEGWLGPLTEPPAPAPVESTTEGAENTKDAKDAKETKEAKEKDAPPADTPVRPPQPKPYNSVADYATSVLPRNVPGELGPSAPVPFPHLLGVLNTPVRLWRFLHRRRVADEIGREVAALCFATSARPFAHDGLDGWEQQQVLAHEEKNWVKTVWKDDSGDAEDAGSATTEKIWPVPVVVDERIGERMRRFELTPEREAAARAIVVPESEIEGWTKGKLRQLGRWAGRKWTGADKPKINIGNLDDE